MMGENKIGGISFDNLLLNFFGDRNAESGQTKTVQTTQTSEPYVVKNGDTLSKIAAKYGQNLQQVIRKNPQIKNPNRIYAGQKINVGNAQSEYVVKNGDTLSSIAKSHNTGVGDILRANPGKINNQNLIYPGQKLRLPQGAEVQTSVKTRRKTAPQTPVITKQPETNKTETPKIIEQTNSPGGLKIARVDLDDFISPNRGGNAKFAILIGNAEGNRTSNGGFTRNYYGHPDPGDGKWNIGSFSYSNARGGKFASSPEEADKIQLQKLYKTKPAYEAAMKKAGLDPNNALLAATYFDAFNQSERAASKMLEPANLAYLQKNGVSIETMKEWRAGGYINLETNQRWLQNGGKVGGGLARIANGRTQKKYGRNATEAEILQTIRADQSRRINEMLKPMQDTGLISKTTKATAPTAPTIEKPVEISKQNGNPDNRNVAVLLPARGTGYVAYNRDGNDQFGTAKTIKTIQDIARKWNEQNPNTPLQIGDISRKGGGRFRPHSSHDKGIDIDIRPIRKDNKNLPLDVRNEPNQLDREKVRQLIKIVRAENPNAIIYFNDSVLMKEGLTKYADGHHNHLHIRLK